MPQVELTPDFIRAVQGLEFGTIALIGSAIVIVLAILLLRSTVKNQADARKQDAATMTATIENQAKLIGHIGTQSVALEKMANAIVGQSEAQERQTTATQEVARINTEGFIKTSEALTNLSARVDSNQRDTHAELMGLREEITGVQKALTDHTATNKSLAQRLDVTISRLDQLLATPPGLQPVGPISVTATSDGPLGPAT